MNPSPAALVPLRTMPWEAGGSWLLVAVWLTFAVLVVVHLRTVRLRPTVPPVVIDQLTPEMVAFVLGGRRRAFVTAVGGLTERGGLWSDRTVVTPTPYSFPQTPLESVILRELGLGTRPGRVQHSPAVRQALDGLQEHLAGAGLAISQRAERTERLLGHGVTVLSLVTFLCFFGTASFFSGPAMVLTVPALPLAWYAFVRVRRVVLLADPPLDQVNQATHRLVEAALVPVPGAPRQLVLTGGLQVAVAPELAYAAGDGFQLKRRYPDVWWGMALEPRTRTSGSSMGGMSSSSGSDSTIGWGGGDCGSSSGSDSSGTCSP